jgi:uncharacterized protein (TIGR02147 family)
MKRKTSFFSFRYIAEKTGLDSGNLAKIFQEQRQLPAKYVDVFCHLLKLNEHESKYFTFLVQFAKARNAEKEKELFAEILKLQRVNSYQAQADQYEYFSKWYHSAVRSLLDCFPFSGDFVDLADRLDPPITPQQAKDSIDLMKKLGLVVQTPTGFRISDKIITTGTQWKSQAIQNFKQQVFQLGQRALKLHEPKRREMSTLTMSINWDDFLKVQEILRQAQEEILKVVENSGYSEDVFQLNVQLFSLTQNASARRGEKDEG